MSDSFNIPALERRCALPPNNDFSIQQLAAMPPYFGWVNCSSGYSDFKMLLGGNDDGVALRFFWNGGYEKTTLKTWARLAKKSELALDIGAHTGAYTLAARTANRDISVAAFEPHFMNFARLNLNMRVNGFATSNAFMHGVGARNETLPFSVSTSLDWLTTGGSIGQRDKGTTTNIQVVALDAFLPENLKPKVTLVKMDTEGFEAECLRGMTGTIAAARPTIFFECIDAKAGAAVQEILAQMGYNFFEIDEDKGTILPVKSIQPNLDSSGRPIYGRLNRIAAPDGRFAAEMLG